MNYNELEAMKYEYILSIFEGTCQLNGYKSINVDTFNENGSSANDCKDECIRKCKDKDAKYYFHLSTFDDREHKKFCVFNNNSQDIYTNSELINMAFKTLNNMDVYDVTLNIESKDECKDLLENLESLGVPSTRNSSNKGDDVIYFDITGNGDLIVHGELDKETSVGYYEIDYEVLSSFCEYKNVYQEFDAFVYADDKDVLSDALIIATDLRDSGFKIETDYSLRKIDENKLEANFLIIVDKKGINNYEVLFKDLKTKETKQVKIDNLIEELSFL